ncbi:putative GPI-anchored protein PB15E9.01c [Stegastes partitus]|uniref:GPI-anchored protein PB15E9.01c n=1 Tax=Stegastes partitus TaxID=144197 RepID=A0A9Y4NTT3_9TELE|nr:PREDICTED: putative GPI-anchored protein PB15E9.01c [Stegastes partitus]
MIETYDIIYFAQYGSIFIRTIVIRFRAVTRLARTNITAAEVGLEFNRSVTPAQLPTPDAVAQVLVNAVSTPNNTFNLSVQADSIQVLQTNIANVTTTASPTSSAATTASSAATTASSAATTASSAATTASSATTTTLSTTNPTTEALVSRQLSFRSVGETFTTDLLNTSSEAFTSRATLITSTLSPFYQEEFPSSFRSLTVDSFSNGSIINNMTLGFASTSVPNDTAIGNVLINAAPNITAFNIDTSSISVEGTLLMQ